MICILVLGVLEGEEKRAGAKRYLGVAGSGCDCRRATRGILAVRYMFYRCQCPSCVRTFAGCSLRRKLGEVYLRSLCVTSYNCIWIYNDLKIKHWIFFKKGEKLPFEWNHAAAAAKSLQSCPTLCDPIDGSPPGFPVPGILQAKHWSGLPFPSPMHKHP